MKHQGLKVGEARVRVTTNAPALLEPQRFFWLDTNFLRVDRIPPEKAGDSFLEIWDGGTGPVMEIEDRNLVLRGGFSRLEETARDLRYSIFGNLGIFSAWVLRTMEQAHAVHTFHACGLVKENRLLIIPGGAGAGKSVFLFAALGRGWRLFSTEFLHFRVGEETVLFKGSLKDAVRLAVPGLDTLDLSERRAADIDRLLEGGLIRKDLTWVFGVRDTNKVFDQLSK